MTIPVLGVKNQTGIGDILAAVIQGVTGITPCLPCSKRKQTLNKLLSFGPSQTQENK